MKKKIFLILLVAICIACLAIALVACNNDAQTPSGGDNNVAHVHSYGEWTVVEPATHTKVGKQECRCECGATVQAEVPKLPDHEFVEWKTVTEPECMQDGLKESECVCGEKRQERIPALGHKWDDGICTKCGEWQNLVRFKTLTFANYNHTASGTVANAVTKFSFANELELSKSSAYEVSYDEHGDNKPDGDEVDLQEGNNTFYITVTRDDDVEIITVSIYRNHMYSLRFDGIEEAQQVEEGHKAVAPQEKPTRTGYTFDSWDFDFDTEINSSQNVYAKWSANVYTVTLDVAGGNELEQTQFEVTYGDGFTFPVATANLYWFMGWSYDEQQITQEDGRIYRWEIADDVTLKATYRFMLQLQDGVIVGNDWGLPSELVIPAKTMDGQDIVGIGENAFRYSSLASVTIPASITSISENAFGGMYADKFSSVHYQGSLKDWCNIEFGNKYSNPMSAAHDGQLFVLDENGEEKEVTGDVDIPDGVTIVTYALCGTTSITSVAIPDSVSEISTDAFASCSEIKSITVSQGNATYQSKDGIVYKVADKTIYIIPKNIQGAVSILDGCLEIGDSIFKDYTGIREITIPDSVTNIGDYAFSGCTGLQTVNWNATSCTKAGSNNYPIFKGCTQLATVNIGENVLSLPENAFRDCGTITKVNVTSLKKWCEMVFGNDEANPLWVVNHGESSTAKLYLNDEEVTEITGLDGLETIPSTAFYRLSDVTSVTIPSSVQSIENSAFANCTGLQTVNWNTTNCTKADTIFKGCTQLTTVNIGENVLSLPENAFRDCGTITKVNVTSLKKWCEIKFGDNDANPLCVVNHGESSTAKLYLNDEEVTEITGLDGLETIPSTAFYRLTNVTSVTIPSSVQSIENSAFANCTGLQTVNWNATNCTKAGSYNDYIFKGCTQLATVNIGENVLSLPEDAFRDCGTITKVNVTSLKKWCEMVFGNDEANPLWVVNHGESSTAKLYLNDEEVTEITGLDGLETIPSTAFYRLANVTSVTIPESVQSISDNAFYGCTGLQTVNWNATNCTKAGDYHYLIFKGCTQLATVNIGENVLSLPENAFHDCTGIVSITIPESVQSIGGYAFSGCTGLQTVNWNATNCTKAGSYPYGYIFGGCTQLTTVNIGGNVLSLPENAFHDCLAIKTVNWNAIDCSSSENSFRDSAELQTINIGAGVENIANAHFDKYTHLKNIEVDPDNGVYCDIDGIVFSKDENEIIVVPYCAEKLTLPEGFEDLASEAVKNSRLTSIYIPSSVNVIDVNMFPRTLQKFEISESNKDYSAFSGVLYNKNQTLIVKAPKSINEVTFPQSLQVITDSAFSDCENLTSVTIPDNVTSIGGYAFSGCAGLKEITIPDSVTSIGYSAFSGCTGLKTVTIGENVTNIENYAFSGCAGLKEITIPDSVTSIGNHAFCDCTGLQTVTIGENVQNIGSAFENCTNLETVTFSGESKLKNIFGDAFKNCDHLKSITIPASVTSIGSGAFEGCIRLKDVAFEDPTGWQYDSNGRHDISEEQLRDHATAAQLLTTTYVKYDWYRKTN